jgi:hypothetical protein
MRSSEMGLFLPRVRVDRRNLTASRKEVLYAEVDVTAIVDVSCS